MIELIIKKSGLHTSIQDEGRSGWQEYGVPVSGAMDLSSLHAANAILQNAANQPCLEMTILGPKILFSGSGLFALTGGNLSPKMNGRSVPMYTPIEFRDGSELSFGKCINGCRSYMAVCGEWMVPKWLGSHSAVPYAKVTDGLPTVLRKDDCIQIEENLCYTDLAARAAISITHEPIPLFPGPEFSLFSSETITDFFQKSHRISAQSNRMGYRLEGTLKGYESLPELISSSVIPGTVQVTTSGQPIVLMADAQTTGGYHRIGIVSRDGINRLGQMKPGDDFYFTLQNA